jgi:hypothetical protein
VMQSDGWDRHPSDPVPDDGKPNPDER